MNKLISILALPGDGVGPEVISQAVKVINTISNLYEISLDINYGDFGGAAFDKHGSPLPDETREKIVQSDAVILGAVGGPKYDDLPKANKPESGLLQLRKENNLFVNIRPIICFKECENVSSIKKEYIENLDIVIIRELVSGLYFGEPRGFNKNKTEAFNTMRYTALEIDRITRYAFKISQRRSKKLHSIDKANVLETSQLWRSRVDEFSKKYRDVELHHMYVDNAAMQLVQNPKQFDVILTENLFGDILSDIASVLTGSIGMLPSASLNDKGFGVYEPIHGSAPDIANKNIVNPIATILSAALFFEYTLKRKDIYDHILEAVKRVLKSNKFTKDITTNDNYITTSDMGDNIVDKIKEIADEKKI